MTEYTEKVRLHGLKLDALEWGNQIKALHVHGLSSMWYDDRPEDTANGEMVTDIEYNNGIIVRKKDGKKIHSFGNRPTTAELVDMYEKGQM